MRGAEAGYGVELLSYCASSRFVLRHFVLYDGMVVHSVYVMLLWHRGTEIGYGQIDRTGASLRPNNMVVNVQVASLSLSLSLSLFLLPLPLSLSPSLPLSLSPSLPLCLPLSFPSLSPPLPLPLSRLPFIHRHSV
eukprot:711449-Rhodomonas_salina.2